MSDIRNILLGREAQRYKAEQDKLNAELKHRQESIKSLLADDDQCFEAEINIIELSRDQRNKREVERHEAEIARHKEQLKLIDDDCDSLREDVISRYLGKLDFVESKPDELTELMESDAAAN